MKKTAVSSQVKARLKLHNTEEHITCCRSAKLVQCCYLEAAEVKDAFHVIVMSWV